MQTAALRFLVIVTALATASLRAADDLCAQPSPEEMAKATGVALPKLPWHVVNFWWDFEKPVEHFASLKPAHL